MNPQATALHTELSSSPSSRTRRCVKERGEKTSLLGCALLLPLHVLIALGLIGTKPLDGLAYFTARIDNAITAVKNAARTRKHGSTVAQSDRSTAADLVDRDSSNT